MKVKCIDKQDLIIKAVTLYKIYEVIIETTDHYIIIDDRNTEGIYQKSRFISLDLHRENLVEEIIK